MWDVLFRIDPWVTFVRRVGVDSAVFVFEGDVKKGSGTGAWGGNVVLDGNEIVRGVWAFFCHVDVSWCVVEVQGNDCERCSGAENR